MNWLRVLIGRLLFPHFNQALDEAVRRHSHKYFEAYEEDKKLQRAHMNQAMEYMQNSGREQKKYEDLMTQRHNEHMSALKSIAEALKS